MVRLGYRKGDYLVQTDGVGVTAHRSECEIQYDGKLKLKDNCDPRHPQEFVFAREDHQAVPDPRPISPITEVFKTSWTDL